MSGSLRWAPARRSASISLAFSPSAAARARCRPCTKFQARRQSSNGMGVSSARAVQTSMLLERYAVRRVAKLIFNFPYVSEHYGYRVTGRVHEIPNAIAASYYGIRRAAERGRLLFAGRTIKRKGVLDLIGAVARNPGVVSKLVLAGNAPHRAYESAVWQ